LFQKLRNSPVSAEIVPLSVKNARNPERVPELFSLRFYRKFITFYGSDKA